MATIQRTDGEGAVTATYTSGGDSRFVDKLYSNVKSDVVEITHDKLENCLLKFYRRHLLRSAWFNPLSLGIGVSLTLATAEFKQTVFGVDAAAWKAFFVIALIGAVIWLAVSLVSLAVRWKETTIEFLINQIKNSRK
jgi:hypothetical protein